MSEPITDERLRQIEERTTKATAGPWAVDRGEAHEGDWFCHVDGWTDTGTEWLNLALDDATFIANARQDVPDLVAEVRRLREMLGRVFSILDGVTISISHEFKGRIATGGVPTTTEGDA